ncbi:MAG: hypothetical protein LLG14_25405 [Nocardiaceae bacterium]|nr:hypothetical protein [Nocardiaceae bacterium]
MDAEEYTVLALMTVAVDRPVMDEMRAVTRQPGPDGRGSFTVIVNVSTMGLPGSAERSNVAVLVDSERSEVAAVVGVDDVGVAV